MNKFKKIPDFPNYEFNTLTLEVKSLDRVTVRKNGSPLTIYGRILKPDIGRGYYRFSLCNENGAKHFNRHQISWLVKYGSLPKSPLQLDHKDNDKTNDYWSNLQILTPMRNR